MIPWVVAAVAVGVGAAAKAIYDAVADSSTSSSSSSDNVARQSEEARKRVAEHDRAQREERFQARLSNMIAGEMKALDTKYLEQAAATTCFDRAAVEDFLNVPAEDCASAEKALSVLCGSPIRMKPYPGQQGGLRKEMQALKEIEQFICEK